MHKITLTLLTALLATPSFAQTVVKQNVALKAMESNLYLVGLMLVISLIGIGMLASKLLQQRNISKMASQASVVFVKIGAIRDAANRLNEGSPYRSLVEGLLTAFKEHAPIAAQVDLNAWLMRACAASVVSLVDEVKTENAIVKLFAVGSLVSGVFCGLFSLSDVLTMTPSTDGKTAQLIGGSLIYVLAGIAISTPLFLGGYYLDRRNEKNIKAFSSFADDMARLFLATASRISYSPIGQARANVGYANENQSPNKALPNN
jgi:hypothetical protein